MSGIDYRTVEVTFRHQTRLAIICDRPRAPGTMSIPRSLIHAADDAKIDGLFEGEKFTFRLAEWKAEEIGLA